MVSAPLCVIQVNAEIREMTSRKGFAEEIGKWYPLSEGVRLEMA